VVVVVLLYLVYAHELTLILNIGSSLVTLDTRGRGRFSQKLFFSAVRICMNECFVLVMK